MKVTYKKGRLQNCSRLKECRARQLNATHNRGLKNHFFSIKDIIETFGEKLNGIYGLESKVDLLNLIVILWLCRRVYLHF